MTKNFILEAAWALNALLYCEAPFVTVNGKKTRLKVVGNSIHAYDEKHDMWTIHLKLTDIIRSFNDIIEVKNA